MDRLLRIALYLSAVVNIAWGLFALLAPARAAEILHLDITSGRGSSELRSVYGGAVAALGAMTVWGLRRPDGASWFELLAYGFFGLCTGRVLSCVLDPNKLYSGGVLALELAFGALLFAASRRFRST